ncbi:MAG: protein kinase domain-containing protein [Gemmatimonadaceae bacterium]
MLVALPETASFMPDLLHRFESLIAERYEVERELGHGGMAVVYLARDVRHSRWVAIKVMRPEIALSLGTERFLREIRIAAGLHHPNILALFDSGQADGLLYFVMPYVSGETLRARLEREQQLRVEDALTISRQVAAALDYAHELGVVHRDIKPENILLTGNGVCVADFGLARALTTAGGERLTDSGIAMGTPSYMSPEQASADREVGAASDIYSLGCVVYEMFAGIPPFSGPNVQTIAMRHMTDTASPLRRLRPSTPESVEAAVAKALEKAPADRFATAGQLAAAMEAPALLVSHVTPVAPPLVPVGHRRRGRWIVLLVALLAAALSLVVAKLTYSHLTTNDTPPLDESRYVVLPFETGGGTPSAWNGDQVSSRLRDALAEWRDLNQVGELQINEALGGGASPHLSRTQAFDIARRLSAGKLVWGRIGRRGDSLLIDAALYDVRSERILRERRVSLSPDLHDLPARMTTLGSSLLLGESAAENVAERRTGSASFAAVTAFDNGMRALRSWSLDTAERHFRLAVELDPSYPRAHLWLAQLLAWSDRAPALARRSAARRAFELRGRLSARDSVLAAGLLSLADSRFPDACRHFNALVRRDSTDFAAWLGAGDCRGNDPIVLPEPRSPSRWSFRGSAQRGVEAYVQALLLVPSASRAFALRRLRRLLVTEPSHPRRGFALSGQDTLGFLGFPSLDHDTLAYIPYRATDMVVISRRSDPTMAAAIAHNRGILRDIASSWVRAYPASADAHESLAEALESTGELSTASSGGVSALLAIQRAHTLSSDSTQRIRLAVSEVRVRLKLSQFGIARQIADSVLSAVPRGSSIALVYSANLSALTGRAHQASGLMRSFGAAAPIGTVAGKILPPQSQLGSEAQALLTYASLGAPADSIRAIARRVELLLRSSLGPEDAASARFGFLGRPLSLAVPVLGPEIMLRELASADYLATMQQLLARHDTARLRAAFDTLDLSRTGARPNDVTADAIYQEAWLLLAMGDSARAMERLDGSLGALPLLSAKVLDQVSTAAAIGRSMALRADLAAATGDRQTARRWATAVVALWGAADAEFAPLLSRMRKIAAEE